MRRLAALLLALCATCVAGSAAAQPTAAGHVEKTGRVLAVVDSDVNAPRLQWLDPQSLKRMGARSVALEGGNGPVFSPNGSRVAVGGENTGVQLVDLRRMKVSARVGRLTGWSASPVAWLAANRLLALQWSNRTGAQLLAVIDPVAKRVVRRVSVDGYSQWRTAGRDLVFVGREGDGIGAASLLVVDRNGIARRVVLDRVQAGGRLEGSDPDAVYRIASPGLAVDPAARHAYVAGESDLVADVDLTTLAVTYRELTRTSSLLGRLRSWLEPTASAKAVSGWSRNALWLGDGRLAVSGSDYDGVRSSPSGLLLADLRSGRVEVVEPGANFALLAGDLLLAAGAAQDGEADEEAGMGVAAFSRDGRRLWSALRGKPVLWLEAAGGYAYVEGRPSYPDTVRVVDLETGAVRTVRGRMPVFVTR